MLDETKVKRKLLKHSYEVIEKITTGAYGATYRCKEIFSGGMCVIKISKLSSTRRRKIFQREEKMLYAFQHYKEVIQLFQAFELDFKVNWKKVKYGVLVLQNMQNDLFEKFIENRVWLMEDLKYAFRLMCKSLKILHDHNYVHLDIKPENFLFKERKQRQFSGFISPPFSPTSSPTNPFSSSSSTLLHPSMIITRTPSSSSSSSTSSASTFLSINSGSSKSDRNRFEVKLCDFGSVHSLDEELPKHIGTGNYKAPELYYWRRKKYHQHRIKHASLSSTSSPAVNGNERHPANHDHENIDDINNSDLNCNYSDELFDINNNVVDVQGGYESEYNKIVSSYLPSLPTQSPQSVPSPSNSVMSAATYSLKKADIWSLGVSLFCMLTGHFPVVYDASSSLKICHVNFPIIDPDCADLVQKMLQFNPFQRPSIDEILSHRWFCK